MLKIFFVAKNWMRKINIRKGRNDNYYLSKVNLYSLMKPLKTERFHNDCRKHVYIVNIYKKYYKILNIFNEFSVIFDFTMKTYKD